MNKSESITKLASALNKAQAEMPPAHMNATNPFLKNKYADLGSVIETAKPILARHGLSVSQFPVGWEAVGVETILMHESGEWISNTISMPLSDEKGKSSAQVAGSIVSYLRRYAYSSVLGMYADEDTDGNSPATPRPTAQATQAAGAVDQTQNVEWNDPKVINAVVPAYFESAPSACSVLSRFEPKKAPLRNFIEKSKRYRAEKDTLGDGKENTTKAIEKANKG